MVFVTTNDGDRVRSRSFHALRDRNLGKMTSHMEGHHQARDRSRVFWTASQDRALLDLMVDQVRRGGKLGNGFRKDSWKHMLTCFNMKFHLRYDVQQLKHRLKYYRNQYRFVKAFLDHGFEWNSSNHTVAGTTDLWESYTKENPFVARYKDKRWPYYVDWCRIFGQTHAVDSQHALPSPVNDVEDEAMMEDSGGESEPRLSSSPLGSPHSIHGGSQNPNNISAENGFADQDKENRIDTSGIQRVSQPRNSWKRRATALHTVPDDIIDAVPVNAICRTESGEDRWPVEKCIEELNSMESLEEELFLKALLAFRDEYNRRVFLSIKEDRRKGWLRLICG